MTWLVCCPLWGSNCLNISMIFCLDAVTTRPLLRLYLRREVPMKTLWQDLRFGARLLRLNPSFACVAVLSLALGIGANTSIFQLLDAVRLRTLPVKDPQQLAVVRTEGRHWRSGRVTNAYAELSNPLWEQIRDHQQAFSSIFAWGPDQFNL